MDLRFYDFDCNLLHVESRCVTACWTVYYNDIGTFEAHFDLAGEVVPVVLNHPYLVVVQGNLAAIVTGRVGGDDLAVFGRTCNWLLTRRTTPAFPRRTGTAAALSQQIVSDAFADIFQQEKGIYLGADGGLTNSLTFWRNVRNPTFEVVRDCLANDDAGHELAFLPKQKRWVFHVRKGVTRNLLISEANRNAHDMEYAEDFLNYYSAGYYERELEDKGDWNAATNTPKLTNTNPANYGTFYTVSAPGTAFGIPFAAGDYLVFRDKAGTPTKAQQTDPISTYVSGTGEGMFQWDAVLAGSNESEAKDSLRTRRWNRSIKGKTDGLQWTKDYQLGDTLRIQVQKGAFSTTQTKRIIGVNVWMEAGNSGEQPIFEDEQQGG